MVSLKVQNTLSPAIRYINKCTFWSHLNQFTICSHIYKFENMIDIFVDYFEEKFECGAST